MDPRLAGHALIGNGTPFTSRGTRVNRDRYWLGAGGPGRAKCTCGELSDVQDGLQDRRDWHRQHKDRVRESTSC